MEEITRSTWTHTLVGLIDSVFHLSDIEKYESINIVEKLLEYIQIPERQPTNVLPYAVSLEANNQFWSTQLMVSKSITTPKIRSSIPIQNYSIDVWVSAFETMLFSAFPSLRPEERILIYTYLTNLFQILGIPDRPGTYIPEQIIQTFLYQNSENID